MIRDAMVASRRDVGKHRRTRWKRKRNEPGWTS
nr:MAG TPA_asm: hypothetical protein [Caudoviricetes sp.]